MNNINNICDYKGLCGKKDGPCKQCPPNSICLEGECTDCTVTCRNNVTLVKSCNCPAEEPDQNFPELVDLDEKCSKVPGSCCKFSNDTRCHPPKGM